MTFFTISSFINGIIAVVFGFFVYLKNKKETLNQTFLLINIGLAIWSFSYWRWLGVDNSESALFWSRMLNSGATLIPIFYLHWVLCLLKLEKVKKKILIFGYLLTSFFILFSFSPLYIKEVKPVFIFPYWPQAGFLYICYIFLGYFGLVGYAFFQLLRALKTSSGYKRAQIKYVLLGTILGFGGGATNFPLMFGLTFLPLGNPLVALYPIVFTYAIIKYRLMDI